MRSLGQIALVAAALGGALAALQWLGGGPSVRFVVGDPVERAAPDSASAAAEPPSAQSAAPVIDFGGAYGEPAGRVSAEEGMAHLELGAKLLEFGDYYSAASHLALARDGLPHVSKICELLAFTYDRLNMTLDLIEIMECLERAASEHDSARRLLDELRRQLDVEMQFRAAASDHFVASFPASGHAVQAVGQVLDILERARDHVLANLGFGSMRLVPVVIYEGGQFEAATDKPHWVSGLYDGKIRIAIDTYREDPDFFEMAVTHEYVHALTHEYTGSRLPPWFREGVADNLARRGKARRDALATVHALLDEGGPLLDIYDLKQNFLDLGKEQALRAYRQSFGMVHTLVQEAGWKAVGNLLLDLHGNRAGGFDDVFTDRYGESPEAFLERWYAVAFRQSSRLP